MAEYYTIGGSLMHYGKKGMRRGYSTTPGYTAIGTPAVGRIVNGRYVYDTVGNVRQPARQQAAKQQAMNYVMNRYRNRRTNEAIARAPQKAYSQISKAAQNAYNQASKTAQNLYGQASKFASNLYSQAKIGAANAKNQVDYGMYKAGKLGSQAISAVKSSAKQVKDWGSRQLDWAGQQVSKALSSARTFISNLLQKIGAGAKAVQKWAVSAYNQASRFAKNTARNAIYKTTRQLTMMPEWSLPQRRRGGGNMRRSTVTSR